MKHGKSITGSIIMGLILVFLVVEISPEIQRVSDQQSKIAERNAEIRAEKVGSFNTYEQTNGKLPTVRDCENVNSGSRPEMRDKCLQVWKTNP